MSTATMTIRLDDHLKTRLDRLAEIMHRSKSFLAAEAINEYLDLHEWQLNEIREGIAEANAGQLIDHSSVVNYWEKKRARLLDKKG